jgi:hypothetical protein
MEMEVFIGCLQSRQLTGTRTNVVASYQWEVCVFFLGGYFIPTQNNKEKKEKQLRFSCNADFPGNRRTKMGEIILPPHFQAVKRFTSKLWVLATYSLLALSPGRINQGIDFLSWLG